MAVPVSLNLSIECRRRSAISGDRNMSADYIQPLQALKAKMVQKRRALAEAIHASRRGKGKRRRKLVKLQQEIDVIDGAIADEQLLAPTLRNQLSKA